MVRIELLELNYGQSTTRGGCGGFNAIKLCTFIPLKSALLAAKIREEKVIVQGNGDSKNPP